MAAAFSLAEPAGIDAETAQPVPATAETTPRFFSPGIDGNGISAKSLSWAAGEIRALPEAYGYGVEYTREQMNLALDVVFPGFTIRTNVV